MISMNGRQPQMTLIMTNIVNGKGIESLDWNIEHVRESQPISENEVEWKL